LKFSKWERIEMIDLFYWPTPNGWKITIMLEECGLPYDVKYVNISKGEQFDPKFLAISPNNRIPAIYDHETFVFVFESGAILQYLAEKTGRFLPSDLESRTKVLEWLFWQMGGLGPMMGQVSHFINYAPQLTDRDISYSLDRYKNEGKRLFGVMDQALSHREYLAEDYSIADMACLPWVIPWKRFGYDIDDFPNLKKWVEKLKDRPQVKKALEIGIEFRQTKLDEEAKKQLFGKK
jgi:GST-like protein